MSKQSHVSELITEVNRLAAKLEAKNKRIAELEKAAQDVIDDDYVYEGGGQTHTLLALEKILGAPDWREPQPFNVPHPDHCLCDECVTLENMDERISAFNAKLIKEENDD